MLFHAQPLPRRRAAGGDGAWLPIPIFNQFLQSTRLTSGAILVANFAESTGSNGLCVLRPGLMHLARTRTHVSGNCWVRLSSESSLSPVPHRSRSLGEPLQKAGAIEHSTSPYQSQPSSGSAEIFGVSKHLQKFPDKPAVGPHH